MINRSLVFRVKNLVKIFLKSCFLRCGFVSLRNFISRARGKSLITVLAYHRVDFDDQDVNAVSPDIFEKQMILLNDKYRVISVDMLFEILATGVNTERCVIITFDDGYLDNIEIVAPILKKYNLSACFFVSSGMVENGRPFPHDVKRLEREVPVMSWSDVRRLSELGFEIGGHSVNHVRLSNCDTETLKKEIYGCKKKIESEIGREIKYFSHPFGKKSDVSPQALDSIRNAGFVCNFSSYGGLVYPGDDLFDIPRMGVSNDPSLLIFEAQIEGWCLRS